MLNEIVVLMEYYEKRFRFLKHCPEDQREIYYHIQKILYQKGFLTYENGKYKLTIAGRKFIEGV